MSKKAEIRERRRRQRRQQQIIVIVMIVGAALIVTALLIWSNFRPIGEVVAPETMTYPMIEGTSIGDPDAPVVIEEFSDFQCSFCRIFHEETLPQIIQEYVAAGEVYFTFNHYAFIGPESTLAANASMCAAEQGLFWGYADIIFANQIGENAGVITTRRLEAYAEAIGLDTDQFKSCLREERYQDQIDMDKQAGEDYGIQSTPSFLINGKLVRGAEPFEIFQAEIEALLAEIE